MKKIYEGVPFEDAYEGFQSTQFFMNTREVVEEVKSLFEEVKSTHTKVNKLTRLTDPVKFMVPYIVS